MSRSTSTNHNDHNGGDEYGPPARLIHKAIRYARTTHHHRNLMRTLLRRVDRVADPYLPPDDPAVPPRQFIDELRRPKTAKRRTIHINVDGKEMPVILNPQGVIDVEREVWLWNYIRAAVRDGAW